MIGVTIFLLLFSIVKGLHGFELDSERIYGVREPDGIVRNNISCPSDLSIQIKSVRYGYKV